MGKRREIDYSRSSQTLPSSPSRSFSSSSSSSSDFEFTISLSPRKSSPTLCPADELFYKGQLLPLHPFPRISMVRTLLLASSSASSCSDSTTNSSRDSTGSSNDSTSSFTSDLALLGECDSSRPSSVTEDDEFMKRLDSNYSHFQSHLQLNSQIKKSGKYFSLSRFSSVFKKEPKNRENDSSHSSSVKRMSATAKEVLRKYLKKVKPLYEKLSQKQQQKMGSVTGAHTMSEATSSVSLSLRPERSVKDVEVSDNNTRKESNEGYSHSFSGNLRYPRRRRCVSSCPSSMRSSPSHSGVLSKNGFMSSAGASKINSGMHFSDTSSMEELQSSIQGAIAHCKNSMMENKNIISHEI